MTKLPTQGEDRRNDVQTHYPRCFSSQPSLDSLCQHSIKPLRWISRTPSPTIPSHPRNNATVSPIRTLLSYPPNPPHQPSIFTQSHSRLQDHQQVQPLQRLCLPRRRRRLSLGRPDPCPCRYRLVRRRANGICAYEVRIV